MKRVYPTFIVDTNNNSEYPFLVCVPDMEIVTEGSSFANAIEMARDAIGLAGISMEDNKEVLPVPSEQNVAAEKVKKYSDDIDFTKGILIYVDIDFTEYRKKFVNY
jgi:predicted RNase H-like HicB family nuclease